MRAFLHFFHNNPHLPRFALPLLPQAGEGKHLHPIALPFDSANVERDGELIYRSALAPQPISMIPSGLDLKANPAERLLQRGASLSPSGPGRYLGPFCACLIYAALLAPLFFEHRLGLAVTPALEIPVDIVVEPPQPKKPDNPPPDPEPQAASPLTDEQPAFDAPRAVNEKKSETEGSNAISMAPVAQQSTKPPDSNSDPAKAAAPKPADAPPPQQSPAEPHSDVAETEPLPTADSSQKTPESMETRADAEAKPQTQTTPDPQPQPQAEKQAASAGDRLPTFASVPDIDFESLAKSSPVAGGQAKATYLSIVYGMIVPRIRLEAGSRANLPKLEGLILFSVDGRGNLRQRRIARSSGSHELDIAALKAVDQASPFPPPPRGAPMGMIFSYSVN
jgi:protein TonB